MKRLLLILLCGLSVSAFAQIDTSKINKTDSKGYKQGVWKKYSKGVLLYEGQFKNDVPYGTFTYYHPNGKVKSITEFQQGVHQVKTTIFHENGHKASEGVFIDQQKNGVWKYYTNTDTLITIEQYDHGKRVGLWQIFSPESGVLLEESNYLNDKLNGIHRTYYTDGEVSLEENFLNGKQNGKCTSYYLKNVIASTGNYLQGFRIGSWDFYDMNGKIRSTMEYQNQHVIKTYVYLYVKTVGQKINQDLIAYFLKKDDHAVAVLRNGNRIEMDENLDQIILWADFTVFTRIAPSVIAATDAIVGYKDVQGSENDAIIIKLNPKTDEDIYSEGTDAKMVKALFNTEKPKE